jgi:hypothetical protein
MSRQVKAALVFVGLLVLGIAADNFRGMAKSLATLLPSTAWQVLRDYWSAVLMTAAGSIVAFAGALCIGWSLGLLGAASHIAAREKTGWAGTSAQGASSTIFHVYNLVYLIPFVLTVTLIQSLMSDASPPSRAGCLLIVAGIALGGYQIFLTFYKSATAAPSVNRELVGAILHRQFSINWLNWISGLPLLRPVVANLSSARRLRDCNIHAFCEALERAWHLSIVAVMIVESLIGSFYELLLPEGAAYIAWKSGLGGLVLSNTGQMSSRIIFGSIWIILIVDWIGLELIRLFTSKKWLKYYE